MKRVLVVLTAALWLASASPATATNCNAILGLLNQGFSPEQIARGGGVSLSTVDACARRRTGAFRLNPAGPPPNNPAGPPPLNAAGPPPLNAAGPPPMNPAGIPK